MQDENNSQNSQPNQPVGSTNATDPVDTSTTDFAPPPTLNDNPSAEPVNPTTDLNSLPPLDNNSAPPTNDTEAPAFMNSSEPGQGGKRSILASVDKRIIAGALGILFVLGSVVAGIVLVQRNQDLRERAAENPPLATQTPPSTTATTPESTNADPLFTAAENMTASCDNRTVPRCGAGDTYGQVFNATDCSGNPSDPVRFCCPEGAIVSTEDSEFYYCKYPFQPDGNQHQCYISGDGNLSRVSSNLFYEPIQFFPPDNYGNVYEVNLGEKVKLGAIIRNLSSSPVVDRIGFQAHRVDKTPTGTGGQAVDEYSKTIPVALQPNTPPSTEGYTTRGHMRRNHFVADDDQSWVYNHGWTNHTFNPGDNTVFYEWTAGEANRGNFTTPTCGIYQVDLLIEGFGENACSSFDVAAGFVRVTGCDTPPSPSPSPIPSPSVPPTPATCDVKQAHRNISSNTPGSYNVSPSTRIFPENGDTVTPGETIVYYIKSVPVPGQNIVITDQLNSNMEYVDGESHCEYFTDSRYVVCQGSTDAAFRVKLSSNPAVTKIDNTAKIGTDECSISIPLEITPSPSPSTAMCTDVKVYSVEGSETDYTNWTELSASDLSNLQPGDTIYLTVMGSTATNTFTKGRFTVNGVLRPEVTDTKPQPPSFSDEVAEFYDEYTIPAGTTSFQIIGEVFHGSLGWL